MNGAEGVQTAYINCMSIKRPHDVYRKILMDLWDEELPSDCDQLETLKAMLFPRTKAQGPMYIVTLDEIDYLLTLDLSLLYTLFEWALDASSRLILIGIANALDLTDRFLPRFKARNLKPHLLAFVPYTAPQIASVITTKLRSLLPPNATDPNHTPFLHPAAIQFVARKVATQTGDLRKAFDMVRRAIDLIETETRAAHHQASSTSSPLSENPNLSSTPSATACRQAGSFATDPLAHLTPETAPRATIAHLARIAAAAFNNGTAARLRSLTLQQKAALCTLLSLEKRTAARLRELALGTPSKSTMRRAGLGVPVRELWDAYCGLCAREGRLAVLSRVEFGEVVDGLEECGLVVGREEGGRRGKGVGMVGVGTEGKRFESRVTEGEIRGALDGVAAEVLKGLLVAEE